MERVTGMFSRGLHVERQSYTADGNSKTFSVSHHFKELPIIVQVYNENMASFLADWIISPSNVTVTHAGNPPSEGRVFHVIMIG